MNTPHARPGRPSPPVSRRFSGSRRLACAAQQLAEGAGPLGTPRGDRRLSREGGRHPYRRSVDTARPVPLDLVAADVAPRRIAPSDAAALDRIYTELSQERRRLRFLSVGTRVGSSLLRQFCGPDHEHREGFVAVTTARDGSERVVGHLCLEPTAPGEMEIAVAVADAYQGHGVGSRLVDEAGRWAHAHGTAGFRAWFAVDNMGIRRLLRHLGRPVSPEHWAAGAVEIAIDLVTPAAPPPPALPGVTPPARAA